MSGLDRDRLAHTVAAIPAGRWISYGDLALACGGNQYHARTLNQHFIRSGLPGAHRVLMADGSVAATALGDPAAARHRLSSSTTDAPASMPASVPPISDGEPPSRAHPTRCEHRATWRSPRRMSRSRPSLCRMKARDRSSRRNGTS